MSASKTDPILIKFELSSLFLPNRVSPREMNFAMTIVI